MAKQPVKQEQPEQPEIAISWRDDLAPHDRAQIEAIQRRVALRPVGAGTDYLIDKLAKLLDEREQDNG